MDTLLLAEMLELRRLREVKLQADTLEGPTWSPAVDVTEDDKAILLCADLPGVLAEDVHVSYVKGEIVLTGKKCPPVSEGSATYHCFERTFGVFHKRLTLPRPVLIASIQASLVQGILTVRLEKHPIEQQPPYRIELSLPADGADPEQTSKTNTHD